MDSRVERLLLLGCVLITYSLLTSAVSLTYVYMYNNDRVSGMGI